MALLDKNSLTSNVAAPLPADPQTMTLGYSPTMPSLIPTDPDFGRQWHLNNPAGYDLNVTAIWDDYTGAGVTVGTIDTGVDYLHADLAPNYATDLDVDVRNSDSDSFASGFE